MSNNLTQYHDAQWWDPNCPLNLLHELNPGRFQYFDCFVPDWRDLRVLDVGCGGGFTCEYLARRGAKVTGVDLSVGALETASKHARQEGLEIEYREASATALPFQDNSFDIVICVDVLEHIPSWNKAISEFSRILKPNGYFLFDTINRNPLSHIFFIHILENLMCLIPKGTHDPRLFIKPEELQTALKENGFGNPTFKGLMVLWSLFTRKFYALASGPCTLMYIGASQKNNFKELS